MRTRYRWDKETKTFIDIGKEWQDRMRQVVGDTMAVAAEHPITGEPVTSRSEWKRILRENNLSECSSRELVNHSGHSTPKQKEIDWGNAAAEAWNSLKYDDVPMTDRDREMFKRQNEQLRRRP